MVIRYSCDLDLSKNRSNLRRNLGVTGGRLAGASTAAAFIEQFIEKDTKWIHLDIAGTASLEKVGATGVMVKTFTELFC